MNCKLCSKELIEEDYTRKQWNYKTNSYKKQETVYCSKKCSKEVLRIQSSINMAKTNRKYASERMKVNNPMFKKEVRDKVSKKSKGRQFVNSGGNGTGLTVPQIMLMDKLGKYNPIAELAIKTLEKRGSGYPHHYKADIAIKDYMLVIEVDGLSHHNSKRKEQDLKKTNLLLSLGWKVIRFKNKEILEDTNKCVKIVGDTIGN